MTRVAVLKGGRSLERQVSLASGARVEDALVDLACPLAGADEFDDVAERRDDEHLDGLG